MMKPSSHKWASDDDDSSRFEAFATSSRHDKYSSEETFGLDSCLRNHAFACGISSTKPSINRVPVRIMNCRKNAIVKSLGNQQHQSPTLLTGNILSNHESISDKQPISSPQSGTPNSSSLPKLSTLKTFGRSRNHFNQSVVDLTIDQLDSPVSSTSPINKKKKRSDLFKDTSTSTLGVNIKKYELMAVCVGRSGFHSQSWKYYLYNIDSKLVLSDIDNLESMPPTKATQFYSSSHRSYVFPFPRIQSIITGQLNSKISFVSFLVLEKMDIINPQEVTFCLNCNLKDKLHVKKSCNDQIDSLEEEDVIEEKVKHDKNEDNDEDDDEDEEEEVIEEKVKKAVPDKDIVIEIDDDSPCNPSPLSCSDDCRCIITCLMTNSEKSDFEKDSRLYSSLFGKFLSVQEGHICYNLAHNAVDIIDHGIDSDEKSKISDFQSTPQRHSKRLSDQSTSGPTMQIDREEVMLVYPFEEDVKNAVTLYGNDWHRLVHKDWLNDSIIDFFLQYYLREIAVHHNSYAFSAMFVPFLKAENNQSSNLSNSMKLATWTKSIYLFDKNLLLFPVHHRYHWSLACVLRPDLLPEFVKAQQSMNQSLSDSKSMVIEDSTTLEFPCLLWIDSLHKKNGKKTCNLIKRFLTSEYLRKCLPDIKDCIMDDDSFKIVSDQIIKELPTVICDIPMQENSMDCGLYVLQCCSILLDQTFISCTQKDVETKFSRLLNPQSFDQHDIDDRRLYIQNVMKELVKEYKISKKMNKRKREKESKINTE